MSYHPCYRGVPYSARTVKFPQNSYGHYYPISVLICLFHMAGALIAALGWVTHSGEVYAGRKLAEARSNAPGASEEDYNDIPSMFPSVSYVSSFFGLSFCLLRKHRILPKKGLHWRRGEEAHCPASCRPVSACRSCTSPQVVISWKVANGS